MIIQTVSLKDPNENYLSCRPSDGSLGFDLVDLDPSCKFFMVPVGTGRTCLKGPNGKFVDNNTITASDAATSLVIKSTSFESFNVNTSLAVPAITYNNDVFIEYRYIPEKNYLALKKSSGTIDIIFSIPYSMDVERNGTMEVILNHMRDNAAGGIIDIELNNKPFIREYAPPTNKFEAQSVSSLSLYSFSGENRLSITLSQGFLGTYCFSDAALVFQDNNGFLRQENSVYALGLSSGSSYNSGKLEDNLRRGDPYLSLEGGFEEDGRDGTGCSSYTLVILSHAESSSYFPFCALVSVPFQSLG